MSYNDLRKGRCSIECQVYFITTVLHQRRPLFSDLYLARQVIRSMKQTEANGGLLTYAWVLMPDHLHWLFQLTDKKSLSVIMGEFKGRTARMGNQYLKRKGQFWQRAFYDHALRKEEDITQIARYIVANPLRAGLVSSIENYPHWDAMWL